jgi:hypothetical protein
LFLVFYSYYTQCIFFSSFTTIIFFLDALQFGMGINLSISCKWFFFFTYEYWHFKPSLFATPGDSTPFHPFHALWKVENAFLAITFWRFTKLAMLTLELVKNGGVGVLSTMPSCDLKWAESEKLKWDYVRRLSVPLPPVLWGDYTWKYISHRWRRKGTNVFLNVKLHL